MWRGVDEPAAPDLGEPVRELDELRRPLPLEETQTSALGAWVFRPYRPVVDDDGLLAVNNRAFEWHPDQGGWNAAQLAERTDTPWFRADDVLVHEDDDGTIDGFCWTRHHQAERGGPAIGEIFAIATDPAGHRRGLGRALAVAGLELQARRGATVASLYVERDNTPAQRLYASMGFTLHRRQVGHLPAASDGSVA